MQLVVNVEQAKGLLKDNREKHINEYKLQLEAWKVEYEKYTEGLRKWSQAIQEDGENDEIRRPKEPQKPAYHVRSYDKLLRKLDVHANLTIEIDDGGYGNSEYDQIFENKFEWSGSFQGLTASYIQSGTISSAEIRGASINNALIGDIQSEE